jgi:hypothetical protein
MSFGCIVRNHHLTNGSPYCNRGGRETGGEEERKMKYLCILFLIVFFVGCATVQEPCVCPPEDIVVMDQSYRPMKILKGMMVPENYYTMPEWDKLLKGYYDSLTPKQSM